ncbi:hypothetical protein [Chitinophaga qingshengii]|uniref:DUF1738 domain-containing protein n=1 Tax=Chitinophaga qingshengii TaxID=1569794 RepID=A0ABR7TND8_9BACT|nr:hypothetical protein [Chitinophaga qingshengii]MBC9931500.1 hypothetical protein [Chitinophaga qingshengii]
MHNPVRKNRNIGTAKQGHGQYNKYKIPQAHTSKRYYELLGPYQKQQITINNHEFLFVTEAARTTSKHACSVNDLKRMIEQIPAVDYGDLTLIVLRQPKRKEEVMAPVWGRLIYSFEFEGNSYPAVILEAVDYSKKIKWPKSLSVSAQKELERLKADGHQFMDDGRLLTIDPEPLNVRQTQLYRTLLHEFGHYVHYLEVVERPGKEEEDYETWEQRYNSYFCILPAEKEEYANRYAKSLYSRLVEQQIIPFDPIADE